MFNLFHQDQWFTALILVVGTVLLTISSIMLRFDYVFYDIGQYLTPQTPPEDIVIIAIDEPSLEQLGKWPWTRETHAQLIKQLSKSAPSAIGVDVLFSEPDVQHPIDDQALAAAIKQSGRVIVPVVIDLPFPGGAVTQYDSLPLIAEQAAGIGRVNVPLDGDGIARGVYLWEGLANEGGKVNWLPHFAQAVLRVSQQSTALSKTPDVTVTNDVTSRLAQSGYKKINFFGQASNFKQVSYVDVWAGRVAPNFFDGKIVLVGATSIGMGDLLATPMSSFSSPMSGVEFNANLIAAMRDEQLIDDLPLWVNTLIAIILVVLPVLWLPNQTPLKSLVWILVYMLAIMLYAIMLPSVLNVWFKPSALLLMVLLAYPIWSWRRLDRAYAHLNVELQQLKVDLMEFGLQPDQVVASDSQSHFIDDLLQSRISQVRYASALLRDLQHKKNETLAFISHDLRMPLATAMMMLNEAGFEKKKDRIAALLDQANLLAENFLSISKAETLNNANFKEVELSGLLQESVDHIYQLAKEKAIKVELKLPGHPVWVSGDFSLLHRACVNVLNNAIKFSDDNSRVEVVLSIIDGDAKMTFKDYGHGIEKEKLEQVFLKFKRLEGQPVIQGTGLGLYFVDVTLKKHNGEAFVESEVGKWTQFTLLVPALDINDDEDLSDL